MTEVESCRAFAIAHAEDECVAGGIPGRIVGYSYNTDGEPESAHVVIEPLNPGTMVTLKADHARVVLVVGRPVPVYFRASRCTCDSIRDVIHADYEEVPDDMTAAPLPEVAIGQRWGAQRTRWVGRVRLIEPHGVTFHAICDSDGSDIAKRYEGRTFTRETMARELRLISEAPAAPLSPIAAVFAEAEEARNLANLRALAKDGVASMVADAAADGRRALGEYLRTGKWEPGEVAAKNRAVAASLQIDGVEAHVKSVTLDFGLTPEQMRGEVVNGHRFVKDDPQRPSVLARGDERWTCDCGQWIAGANGFPAHVAARTDECKNRNGKVRVESVAPTDAPARPFLVLKQAPAIGPELTRALDALTAAGRKASAEWKPIRVWHPSHDPSPYLKRGEIVCANCGTTPDFPVLPVDTSCVGTKGQARREIESSVLYQATHRDSIDETERRTPEPGPPPARYRSPAGFGARDLMGGAFWGYGWTVRR